MDEESATERRTELPDGCYYIRGDIGKGYSGEKWYDRYGVYHRDDGPCVSYSNGFRMYCQHGKLHCLDGPAVIHRNGGIQYFVDGNIPTHILDIVITDQEFDYEAFPSASPVAEYLSPRGYKAYRINDPDELTLAILRYS